MEFKPLDQYGNWVSIRALDLLGNKDILAEARSETTRQIMDVVPACYLYSVKITSIKDYETLELRMYWKYTPSISTMENQVHEIGRSLNG